jgi:hypothetical protein
LKPIGLTTHLKVFPASAASLPEANTGVVETPQQVPVMVADRLQTYRTYDVALVAPD